MTPMQFDLLMKQAVAREERVIRREQSLAAVQTAALANMLAPRQDKRAWQASDFLPEDFFDEEKAAKPKPQPGGKPRQSPGHMKSLLLGLTHALGGEVQKKEVAEE